MNRQTPRPQNTNVASAAGMIIGLALLAGCASSNGTSAGERLAAPDARITDSVIRGDLATIRALNARMERLNSGGIRNVDYHLTKARNWVDFAYHEYSENDRSAVTEQALTEAAKLIRAMEAGEPNITMDTPVIGESVRIREDLWEIAARLKRGDGFRCAQTTLAELEVALVWAGHEYQELGWRHAVPHIDYAERIADQAILEYDNCGKPLTPVDCPPQRECPAIVAPRPVITSPPVFTAAAAAERMPKRVHFAFDRDDLTADTQRVLREVVSVMRRSPGVVLRLVGHTDPYGTDQYNQDLSKRRVQNVKRWLMDHGVSSRNLQTEFDGEHKLRTRDCTPRGHASNRRVEFFVLDNAGNPIELFDQEEDIKAAGWQSKCER